jgi:hypothetical protein
VKEVSCRLASQRFFLHLPKRKHWYSFILAKLVKTSAKASLAQSVERETLNLKVAGSTPAWGFILSYGRVWFENFLLFCLLPGGHGIALDTVLRSKDHSVCQSPRIKVQLLTKFHNREKMIRAL